MSADQRPGTGVSTRSLRDADRRLAMLSDVTLDEDQTVPPWLVAARRAVAAELRRRDTDE